MASSSADGARAGAVDVLALKSELYDRCCAENIEATWTQAELLDLGVIPHDNVAVLLEAINRLTAERLFKPLQRDGGLAWQARPVAEASKYKGLTSEQAMVFGFVDDAGAEGIWSKTIKNKSGLHDSILRQAIKTLESKRLISDMKSVQHPTRKMYIKTSIQPSDAATGGAWFTDGELDESFIEAICDAIFNHIWAKSFYQSSAGRVKKPAKRTTSKKSAQETKAARDAALEPQVKLEDEPDEQMVKQNKIDSLLPLPPGYQSYPTIIELTRFVDNIKITDAALTQVDIQQLVDILVWDNKIEEVLAGPQGISYRALRKTAHEMEEGPTNGLTTAPCGQCPVFDLCEEGGPVAPSNCDYFKRWLDPQGF